ncbi:hypothetical protein N7528_008992 [Penicillium herquei]|nr:hypothetical protein N7528_008992 [Penicillium herquei]
MSSDPQVISNELTIIFGVITTILAIAGILVSLYQYRKILLGSQSHHMTDIEMQMPAPMSQTTNTEPTADSASHESCGHHHWLGNFLAVLLATSDKIHTEATDSWPR